MKGAAASTAMDATMAPTYVLGFTKAIYDTFAAGVEHTEFTTATTVQVA